jgi:type II secretory pathway component PulM
MGTVESAEKIARLLQVYGGWGMCAVLIVGIVALYWSMSKVLVRQNEQLQALLKETTAVLTQARDTNREVAETNREAATALDRVERQLIVLEGFQRNR